MKIFAIISFILLTGSTQIDVYASTADAYKTTDKIVKTENPVYVQVTGVKACCIELVTKTLQKTNGVMSAQYDHKKGLYVITINKNFELRDAQKKVASVGNAHGKKLNQDDRPEWLLSRVDATAKTNNTKDTETCGKGCKGEGKGCCSKS